MPQGHRGQFSQPLLAGPHNGFEQGVPTAQMQQQNPQQTCRGLVLTQPFQGPGLGCEILPVRRYTSPSITTFHNILASLEPQTLEQATRAWAGQQSAHIQARPAADAAPATGSGPAQLPAVSLDGKDVRGASQQTKPGRRMLLAAVEQDSGVVLGQLEIDSKSNEIPAFCDLARQLPLQGRVLTGDALHAQHKTARCVLDECQAEYLITAIQGNQPTILADLRSMDFSDCPLVETSDRKHGRSEHRSYQVKDISAAAWDGSAKLYGRQQAIRVERRREHVKSGTEVTYALTSAQRQLFLPVATIRIAGSAAWSEGGCSHP